MQRFWGALRAAKILAPCLAFGCGETDSVHVANSTPAVEFVRQTVSATVRREALQLVHVETESETLLTTPEHPFATPDSGWVAAAALEPGQLVVSARFGAVRVSSVRRETLLRPVPVFNLTVQRTHAYVVGRDEVLVHNAGCGKNSEDLEAQRSRELEETLRERDALARTEATSPEHAAQIQREIAALDDKLKKIRRSLRNLRYKTRKNNDEVQSAAERVGPERVESQYEATQKELREAEDELGQLEHAHPRSAEEHASITQKRAELAKRIAELKFDLRKKDELLNAQRELAELGKTTPQSDRERADLEERKQLLKAKIRKLQFAASQRKRERRERKDPTWLAKHRAGEVQAKKKAKRTKGYVEDSERPRDKLELLEQELLELSRSSHTARHADYIEHVQQRIDTLTNSVAILRRIEQLDKRLYNDRRRREALREREQDVTEIDRRISENVQQRSTLRTALAKLRAREALLGRLGHVAREGEPHREIDEARLREIERELAEAGGQLDDARLDTIQRELDDAEPIDAEFLERIWREAEASQTDLRERLDGETEDVNEALRAIDEFLQRSPSPERTAEVESGLRRLQNELRDERAQFEANDFALANEYAFLTVTRGQPGTSSHTASSQRLERIQAERARLRRDWQTRMQARVDDLRRQLQLMRSVSRLHDETIEADLAQQIALLEHELANPVF